MKVAEYAPCPGCGTNLTGATGVNRSAEGKHPKEGDYTICVYCGYYLVFRADMSVRQPTPKEYLEIDALLSDTLSERSPPR